MTDIGIATYLVAAGIGTLAFLKIVCDEIIVKYRVLELRVEVEAEKAAAHNRTERDQSVTTLEIATKPAANTRATEAA